MKLIALVFSVVELAMKNSCDVVCYWK
uniref:Uncharacterized protein n=1 Tax=Arundo donax TaxID=35708 RepID=A0A0A8ZNB4_ARUDO